MYLFGNYNGSKYNFIIDATTKKSEVLTFLKDNPEFQNRITNEVRVKAQYLLMGIDYIKEVIEAPIKAKKNGSKKR